MGSIVVVSVTMSLLGSFGLACDGRRIELPGTIERLLAFLALQRGPLPRIFVGASLWPETTDGHARGNLRTALWRLNGLLDTIIEVHGTGISLDPLVDVDLHRMVGLAHGVITREIDPCDVPLTRLTLAGELLPGWYDDWVVQERESIRELRLHALELVCQELATVEEFGTAIDAGLAAVACDPLRESAHRVLIRAYLLEGNLAMAIRQYDLCRTLLADELGVEPSRRMGTLLREHGLAITPGETLAAS